MRKHRPQGVSPVADRQAAGAAGDKVMIRAYSRASVVSLKGIEAAKRRAKAGSA